ncbi:hypothetical protein Q4E93_22000 [Flavitalea sp. BT771]|uniref:hypothetical protein n=1 Tax=Flavitalea sp. BT771 TaxID=3063329 RepID=UPI0026E18CC0|nr:hypothetical protein [Flavitalea sp. BT771]MDO6433300.1 hypothetical protein [Flavitalea sp. BT771]MDV6222795.1 hypothetical protein [Flavitalea sp. BT771]
MKTYRNAAVVLLLFLCEFAIGQTTIASAVKSMFVDQKKIYKTKSKSIRKEYKLLTESIPTVQKYLLASLHFLDSTILPGDLNVNIFEGRNETYGNIYGVLWWADEYYEFALQDKMRIEKKTYNNLSDDNKKIVASFSDWQLPIFKNNEYDTSMRIRGDDICQVYLASKYNPNLKQKAKSIGFYY